MQNVCRWCGDLHRRTAAWRPTTCFRCMTAMPSLIR